MSGGRRYMYEISISSVQFCCKPKPALKDKIYFLKQYVSHFLANNFQKNDDADADDADNDFQL